MWRLSEAGPHNLGLACTGDGLLLGHTSLIEHRDGRFVVRTRDEIERLLKCAYDGEPPVDRLMSGLVRVASALNANDQCGARIAAVQMQVPDLASAAVRNALAAEDSLIKYSRDEGVGAANWNPALHPRTDAPPNPGWFATTDGASHHAPNVRVAENNNPTQRFDASPGTADNWVRLPPAKRIDELGDFLEWLANAKPEDEGTIRAEINRYWVGDVHALSTLHSLLSEVLKPGATREDRQQILELIDNYSRHDPAEAGQFYDQLFDLFALLGAGVAPRPRAKVPVAAGAPDYSKVRAGSQLVGVLSDCLELEYRARRWRLSDSGLSQASQRLLGRRPESENPISPAGEGWRRRGSHDRDPAGNSPHRGQTITAGGAGRSRQQIPNTETLPEGPAAHLSTRAHTS